MTRLLWKELRYNWWILGIGCGAALFLLATGDPLYFRNDSSTNAADWWTLVAMLLGLRAYSSELAGDTVQFLGSRPLRWWQVWIAKLVAGLMQVALLVVVTAGLYALFVPDQYRPLMLHGMMSGGWECLVTMALLFSIGYAASILMPGVPLSAAALVPAGVILFTPYAIMANSESERIASFAADALNNSLYLLILAVPLASLAVARRLPQMSIKRRWVTWMVFPAVVMVIGGILAGLFGPLYWWFNASPSADYRELSPDGKWAICTVADDHMYLMDTPSGKRHLRLPGKYMAARAWSSDSCEFAYCDSGNGIGIVSIQRMQTSVIRREVHSSLGLAVSAYRLSMGRLVWSPSGDRLAVIMPSPKRHGVVDYYVVVFSPDGKTQSPVSEVPVLQMNQVAHYRGGVPAFVNGHLMFWPSNDGGRFVSVSYFEHVSLGR